MKYTLSFDDITLITDDVFRNSSGREKYNILILATINRIISPSHPPANTAVSVSLVFCVIRNDISKGQKIIHPMMISPGFNPCHSDGILISPESICFFKTSNSLLIICCVIMVSPYPTQHVMIILYAGNSLLSLKALSDYQHQVFFPEPAFLHYIY